MFKYYLKPSFNIKNVYRTVPLPPNYIRNSMTVFTTSTVKTETKQDLLIKIYYYLSFHKFTKQLSFFPCILSDSQVSLILSLLLCGKVCSADINCGIDFNGQIIFFIYSLIICSCSGLLSQWQRINMTLVTVHLLIWRGREEGKSSFLQLILVI